MLTTYETQQNGIKIRVLNVPTTFDVSGEELGFSLKVMRDLEVLITQALSNPMLNGAASGDTNPVRRTPPPKRGQPNVEWRGIR